MVMIEILQDWQVISYIIQCRGVARILIRGVPFFFPPARMELYLQAGRETTMQFVVALCTRV